MILSKMVKGGCSPGCLNMAHLSVCTLIILLTRWFIVRDPGMLLTGDECVVALMGHHLLEGRLSSGYFLGQHYGFSVVEAVCCAIGIALGGYHTIPIKLSMLVLFVPAAWCFFRFVEGVSTRRLATVALLAWTCIPPWTLWSMQCRGGYATGALAAMGACVLLAHETRISSWLFRGGFVICLVVVILSQVTWLAALVPLSFGLAWQRGKMKSCLFSGLSALLIALVLHGWLRTLTEATWHAPPVHPLQVFLDLSNVPTRLWEAASTNLFIAESPNLGYGVAGVGLVLLLLAGGWIQGSRLIRRSFHPVSHVLATAVLCQVLACLSLPPEPRYLLPVFPFFLAWLAVECSCFPLTRGWMASVLVAGWIMICAGGVVGMMHAHSRPGWDDSSLDESMHQLVQVLEDGETLHLYSLDPLLQWILMFYSEERIACRWTRAQERLPELVRKVDQAHAEGKATAVIGIFGWSAVLNTPLPRATYGIPGLALEFYPNPSRELLDHLGFE